MNVLQDMNGIFDSCLLSKKKNDFFMRTCRL